ncbi:MAG: tetratricopeptide repeat protein, partial [Nitrospirota bacterium]
MRTDKKPFQKADKKTAARVQNRGVVGYSKKSALLEEAITHMNAGKYGRSSAVLKELLVLDPHNTEARRLFATLHLRLGSLVTARQAFESLAKEAIERQDLWLAESLLREYLAAGPRCVPFLELLAHVYEEKGDAMAAVAELGKAIEILIEDPDSENHKKPSQLYAKVRELAPVSPVAFQFDSLFDIQTGELLVPHPPASAAVMSLAVDGSYPQGEIPVSTTESSASSDIMPWEQFDGAPKNRETLLPTSSNPVIESLDTSDALIDQAPVGLVSQELEISPPESAGPIQEASRLDQGMAPSILAVPLFSSNGHREEEVGDTIVDRSPVVEEERTSFSSNERSVDVERDSTPSVEAPVLSSPMPWEDIENSTIRIEEAALPTAPLAQSEQALLLSGESALTPTAPSQPEVGSDQLSSLVPVPDLTEPSESIFAVEPSTIPAVHPESEVPTPSAADFSPTAPIAQSEQAPLLGGESALTPTAPSQPEVGSD